jgi:hypothetical protein
LENKNKNIDLSEKNFDNFYFSLKTFWEILKLNANMPWTNKRLVRQGLSRNTIFLSCLKNIFEAILIFAL